MENVPDPLRGIKKIVRQRSAPTAIISSPINRDTKQTGIPTNRT
jgi:hypothetical protein